MKSTATGRQAEQAVAESLQSEGYKILARNWKTAICEIDIVARKNAVVCFIEVKYRSSKAQGGGLDYVGRQKLKKIHFAARVWIQTSGFDGDYRLMAAEVSGTNFENIKITEIDG